MLLFLAYPIASIGNNGLTAKVLSGKTQGTLFRTLTFIHTIQHFNILVTKFQGLGQGVRRLLGSMGLVLGPIWGGSTMKQPYWLLGVPMVILVLNGVSESLQQSAMESGLYVDSIVVCKTAHAHHEFL